VYPVQNRGEADLLPSPAHAARRGRASAPKIAPASPDRSWFSRIRCNLELVGTQRQLRTAIALEIPVFLAVANTGMDEVSGQ